MNKSKLKKEINESINPVDYYFWIGKEIVKHSDKPFKSGFKTGIPKDVGVNPNSNKMAFIMSDDDTYVDCKQCKLKDND